MTDHWTATGGAILTFFKSAAALKLFAAAAGAVISLSFIDKLTLKGRVIALFQGFLTAVFLAPMISSGVAHAAPVLAHVEMGVHFLVSLSAMAILPPFLEWARAKARDPFAGWGGWLSSLLRRPPTPPANPGGTASTEAGQ